MNLPLASVVIPTKNSDSTLRACLESIKNQTYSKIEIIVVDNHSTDTTADIALEFTSNVYTRGPERSPQRNYGVKKSEGTYVFIIDSDMVLEVGVVEEAVKCMSDNKIEAVVIPEISFGKGFWAKCKMLERSFYEGVTWLEAARVFRRSTFLKLGGYDENMISGEDWEFSQRASNYGKSARIVSSIRHNEGELKLIKYLKKKAYYAKSFNKYEQTMRKTDELSHQTNLIYRYWIFLRNPKHLFKNPALGLGMLYMKTLEFGITGIIIIKLKLAR